MEHHIVCLTGAGISKESGISTFRDQNGLWENHKTQDVATPDGFAKNPQLVLDFYNTRRKQLDKVEPNQAHRLLAELEKKYKVSVITQNIDNLHERAGSSKVLHLHGQLTECRSSKNENLIYPYVKDLKEGDLAEDGSQLRPNIVWFGENVTNLQKAIEWVQSADLFVIIGTSMIVHPAALLLQTVPVDMETVYIDPNPNVEEGISLTVIKQKASSGLKFLIDEYLPY